MCYSLGILAGLCEQSQNMVFILFYLEKMEACYAHILMPFISWFCWAITYIGPKRASVKFLLEKQTTTVDTF
jgi:hypothetical protein